MVTTPVADPIAGLREHLLAQDDLNELVSGRIFGGRLPPNTIEELKADPTPALAIRSISGRSDTYTVKIIYTQVEFRIYGRVEKDLADVWWELYRLLNGMSNVVVPESGTRIMSILMDGGFADYPDQDYHGPVGIGRALMITQFESTL